MKNKLLVEIEKHQTALRQCQLCDEMHGPAVVGNLLTSKVMLVGQAPGFKEIEVHKPFAWTAGKTLFKWFASIGVEESKFRDAVYMAAVCRCYPGKKERGGDRVPTKQEIEQCSQWLNKEMELLQPALIIPVGKLAISQFLNVKKLTDVIGKQITLEINNRNVDIIPLPHPSGVSTWHVTEPGKILLKQALNKIKQHKSWSSTDNNH